MVSLVISSAGKSSIRGLPLAVDFPGKDAGQITVADVKSAIARKLPKLGPTRQKIALKGDKKLLRDDSTLKDIGIGNNGELTVKDLGPQIAWKTVFLVEYLGPIVIHPIIYHFPQIFYGHQVQHSQLQNYVYWFVLLHFIKRELETLFVHRFSHATMPLRNIFKNSAHYHVVSGFALAYDIYRPKYAASSPFIRGTFRDDPKFLLACAAVWLFAELSNLSTHLTLRSLRPEGTTKRAIPHGYGFSLISCPNYFFESIAWLAICIMTNSLASWVFAFLAIVQMGAWAAKKHRNYKKEFGSAYPKGRWAMVPFIF